MTLRATSVQLSWAVQVLLGYRTGAVRFACGPSFAVMAERVVVLTLVSEDGEPQEVSCSLSEWQLALIMNTEYSL